MWDLTLCMWDCKLIIDWDDRYCCYLFDCQSAYGWDRKTQFVIDIYLLGIENWIVSSNLVTQFQEVRRQDSIMCLEMKFLSQLAFIELKVMINLSIAFKEKDAWKSLEISFISSVISSIVFSKFSLLVWTTWRVSMRAFLLSDIRPWTNELSAW